MPLDDEFDSYRCLLKQARAGHQTTPELNELLRKIRKSDHITSEEAEWLQDRLTQQDPEPDFSFFVGTALESVRRLSDFLFESLIRASVYEADPSKNRYLIEPAVRGFSFRRVGERLMQYLDEGTDFEKAGAVNALYWARVLAHRQGEACEELAQRIRDKFLTEFVSNEDVQVRTCIIPSLSMDESEYSPEIGDLVGTAIDIARNHPDDYIRHRVEVQLGNETLLKPLPEREQ